MSTPIEDTSSSKPAQPTSYEGRLKAIGKQTKQQEIRDKDRAREAKQFGVIPKGTMRERAEDQILDSRRESLPTDQVNAFKWAEEKGLTEKYVRSLIKQKEGSLPLVGGTLPYSAKALESLYRYDLQVRREKGIKRSAAARFKAERMKLAVLELDEINAGRPASEKALRARIEALESSNLSLQVSLDEAESSITNLTSDLEESFYENDILQREERVLSPSRQAQLAKLRSQSRVVRDVIDKPQSAPVVIAKPKSEPVVIAKPESNPLPSEPV